MTLYRSLMFRELRITRKTNIVRFILYILFSAMFIILVYITAADVLYDNEDPENMQVLLLMISFWITFTNVFGGLITLIDNGLTKEDIFAGWTRYSRALPVSPIQKTASSFMVKGLVMAVMLAFTIIQALMIQICTGVELNILPASINLFLIGAFDGAVFTLIQQIIYLRFNKKQDIKKVGLIAFAVFYVTGSLLSRLTSGGESLSEKMRKMADSGDSVQSTEMIKRYITTTGSVKITLIALALLAVTLAVHFIIMKKSYERREA